MRLLDWHEEEDDEDPEKAPWPVPRGVPGKRKQATRGRSVVAEAEAVVLEYQKTRAEALTGSVASVRQEGAPWERLKTGREPETNEEWLALALGSILLAGAIALLGHALKKTLPVGIPLDARLATLFNMRSMRRAEGALKQAFQGSFTEPQPL